MYDYGALRGKIKEVYGSEGSFAKAMGVTGAAMSFLLNNKHEWGQKKVCKAASLLNINQTEIGAFFYTIKV